MTTTRCWCVGMLLVLAGERTSSDSARVCRDEMLKEYCNCPTQDGHLVCTCLEILPFWHINDMSLPAGVQSVTIRGCSSVLVDSIAGPDLQLIRLDDVMDVHLYDVRFSCDATPNSNCTLSIRNCVQVQVENLQGTGVRNVVFSNISHLYLYGAFLFPDLQSFGVSIITNMEISNGAFSGQSAATFLFRGVHLSFINSTEIGQMNSLQVIFQDSVVETLDAGMSVKSRHSMDDGAPLSTLQFENCKIGRILENALSTDVHDVSIHDCTIDTIFSQGLHILAHRFTFDNNTVGNLQEAAFDVRAGNIHITNNTFVEVDGGAFWGITGCPDTQKQNDAQFKVQHLEFTDNIVHRGKNSTAKNSTAGSRKGVLDFNSDCLPQESLLVTRNVLPCDCDITWPKMQHGNFPTSTPLYHDETILSGSICHDDSGTKLNASKFYEECTISQAPTTTVVGPQPMGSTFSKTTDRRKSSLTNLFLLLGLILVMV